MIVQCEGCGRVRVDGAMWVHAINAKVDRVGHCGLCGTLTKQAQERKWAREGRKLLRDRKRGYGPAKTGEDPFR